MQIVQAPRASAILYNLLKSRGDSLPWLLPANICPIVPITFLKAKVPFEFADISARTLHMDLDQADALIKTRKFGGLLYAHTYGEVSTPNEFFRRIKQMGEAVLVVDDRCLCVPDLEFDVDNLADVQLYSTGYAKIVDLGFGGYAFLKDELDYQPVRLRFDPRAHDRLERDYKLAIKNGAVFEYRDCDWLQIEAGLTPWQEYCLQIEKAFALSMVQRSRLNTIYAQRLPPEIQLPGDYQTWRFNIRVKGKSRVLDAIFNAGLFASSHYASLAGIMTGGKCPQAESLYSEVINLFNDHHFDEEGAERICEIIGENIQ